VGPFGIGRIVGPICINSILAAILLGVVLESIARFIWRRRAMRRIRNASRHEDAAISCVKLSAGLDFVPSPCTPGEGQGEGLPREHPHRSGDRDR
jgi:hypothetical protein